MAWNCPSSSNSSSVVTTCGASDFSSPLENWRPSLAYSTKSCFERVSRNLPNGIRTSVPVRYGAGKTVAKLSTWDGVSRTASCGDIAERLADDVQRFQERHRL